MQRQVRDETKKVPSGSTYASNVRLAVGETTASGVSLCGRQARPSALADIERGLEHTAQQICG